MGSKRRPLFDLNELPVDEEEGSECIRQEVHHLDSNQPGCLPGSVALPSNSTFSHEPHLSGFHPFVKPSSHHVLEECIQENLAMESDPKSYISGNDMKSSEQPTNSLPLNVQNTEQEEGEWLGTEASVASREDNGKMAINDSKPSAVESAFKLQDQHTATLAGENRGKRNGNYKRNTSLALDNALDNKEDKDFPSLESNAESDASTNSQKEPVVDQVKKEPYSDRSNNTDIAGRNAKTCISDESHKEFGLVQKPRETKGVEGSHALRCANNPVRRPNVDQRKEAMLGKKRSRQTMFLNLEDVKQVSSIKAPTSKRQNSSFPSAARTVKEVRNISVFTESRSEKKSQPLTSYKPFSKDDNDGSTHMEKSEYRLGCNGNMDSVYSGESSKQESDIYQMDEPQVDLSRQSSLKQLDSRVMKNTQTFPRIRSLAGQRSMDSKSVCKKLPPPKRQTSSGSQLNDTSVERLLREITSEKFWQPTEETDLQSIPGRFESVGEYISVFEPLLFEECRAQLCSTWEELTEIVSRDAHVTVRVKSIERRERGWYDVIVLPANECKWMYKEGDVAILSSPKPGPAKARKSSMSGEDSESGDLTGRVVGTVRRYFPIDPRDPQGAILHFYVGDAYETSSKVIKSQILSKIRPKGIWYLTVLGPLATTQREYIALHAFRRLNMQMQTAILQPSPDHFPKYEEQPPAMPECFTPNFADYLRHTFNVPQLAAIQWAAMHTAAGTGNGIAKRQDPWPFTLVQGPPGTGKTHTVWGMLNVIHLVQYQHYYTALLKKLAPDSYKQNSDTGSDNPAIGSIDEVLHHMDQNLFRTLPKLCPKPRMLVCAPSNAATDELLSRVLDRGFIDGEMKVYRPDVARVGVDSQTRAAQAVSVERRTEQLLVMNRDEVIGWIHQLRARESQFAQQISSLQRELNSAAAAGRLQGSVGVDPEMLVARDQNRDVLLQNLAAAVEGRDKILVEMSRFAILENRYRPNGGFNMEEARADLEASFANEAEIVFTTVSSSGRKLFSRLTHGFDMVVIDEAAQASEVAVLPPLSLGAARCVLVGDPQQLPATVISKAAGTLLYSRSLFERFQQAGCPTMLLSVQYRMHPQIRDFPSRYFYHGRLTDSENLINMPDEVYHKDPLLRPYLFYDVTHGRESHHGGSVSYQNIHEAQFCLRLYEHLLKILKSHGISRVSVGLITPYKLQLKCLQREFEPVLSSEEGKDLYINTVDAFQGQERDVIIMSCVRASNHGVGFVSDVRRMNVALTRARRALWVTGNANALMQCDDWAALINDAKARRCFVDMDSLPKDFLLSKGPMYTPISGKVPTVMRTYRGKI